MHNCFLEENVPSRLCCTNDSISWIDRHHPLVAQHRSAWAPLEALEGEMRARTRVTANTTTWARRHLLRYVVVSRHGTALTQTAVQPFSRRERATRQLPRIRQRDLKQPPVRTFLCHRPLQQPPCAPIRSERAEHPSSATGNFLCCIHATSGMPIRTELHCVPL